MEGQWPGRCPRVLLYLQLYDIIQYRLRSLLPATRYHVGIALRSLLPTALPLHDRSSQNHAKLYYNDLDSPRSSDSGCEVELFVNWYSCRTSVRVQLPRSAMWQVQNIPLLSLERSTCQKKPLQKRFCGISVQSVPTNFDKFPFRIGLAYSPHTTIINITEFFSIFVHPLKQNAPQ